MLFLLIFFIDSFSMDSNQESLNFKNEWRCHQYLIIATQKLNSMYTIPLFLWIAAVYVSLIVHIFFIIHWDELSIYEVFHGIMSTIFYTILLTALAAVCELTSYEVN